MKPLLTMPLAAWPVSSAFSDNFMRGAAPWPSRSSGTKAAPMRRRSVTLSKPAASPSMTTAPPSEARRSPDNACEQFVLAVAGDAGDADDLAAAHFERYFLEPRAMRVVRLERELVNDEPRHRRRHARTPPSPRRSRRRPSCGQRRGGLLARIACRDLLAARAGSSLCRTAACTSSSLWLM